MRLVGWALLLLGGWSIGSTLTAGRPVGTAAVLAALLGAALLTPQGRRAAAWVGEGILTGLYLLFGTVLFVVGAVALIPLLSLLGGEAGPPLQWLVFPAGALGFGVWLVIAAGRRLWRQSRRP